MARARVNEFENTFIKERVAYLIPQFEKLAPYGIKDRKKGKGDDIGWERLAAIEARVLKQAYPDLKPDDEKEYGTALRQITALKKELNKSVSSLVKDAAIENQVKTIIKNFSVALSFLFSEYKERQNNRYRQEVKDRSTKDNRIEIDLTNSLEFAHNILTQAQQDSLQAEDWDNVSCSLALCTGRRMAEIHQSGEFETTGDYEVGFKGQLKGKNRKVRVGNKLIPLIKVTWFIPTLVNASLVVSGIEWLEKHEKRVNRDDDPERVNRRYSKTLNLTAKNWECLPEDSRTYHKFRAVYLRACIVNDGNVDPYDFTDYAKEILGDDDESTINAYKRYTIKKDSKTKI